MGWLRKTIPVKQPHAKVWSYSPVFAERLIRRSEDNIKAAAWRMLHSSLSGMKGIPR